MSIVLPTDKQELRKLLDGNPYLHIYSIGDLDEQFWPLTEWYGFATDGLLRSVICIYKGGDIPTVMALCDNPDEAGIGGQGSMRELIQAVKDHLPEYFYAHLSPGLEEFFRDTHVFESSIPHFKMALTDTDLLGACEVDGTVRLGLADIPQLLELYRSSYPGNWFDPEMMEQNRYFGIFEGGRLVSTAGTHVYSPEYKASALGNITTLPEYRSLGYGGRVTAALCRMLISEGILVGLNVSRNNNPAISCYQKIGFEICTEYGEFCLRRKSGISIFSKRRSSGPFQPSV